MKYRFSTKIIKILNLKGIIPNYCNNIDVSKIFDAALLFTSHLLGTLNELEEGLKTWTAI